jgi:hypothetical protein
LNKVSIKITFYNRLPEIELATETEAWLYRVLPRHVTTDVTPAITAIVHVYVDYVKAARWHFLQVENHVTSRDTAKIAHFMSRYLGKDLQQ